MLKYLRAVPENAEKWGAAVKSSDPHFSIDYYRAFGGGALAVLYDGDEPKAALPFRHQGDQWVGNAYNFGGAVGDAPSIAEFYRQWEASRRILNLNERCTVSPFIHQTSPPGSTVVFTRSVLVDLTKPLQIRGTTRRLADRWVGKLKFNRVDPDRFHAEAFWHDYDQLMASKDAEAHWRYNLDFFYNVLTNLGPDRSALFATTNKDHDTVSWCLMVFDEKVCYYHWAARHSYSSPPDHFQVMSAIQWAQSEGKEKLFLGGGNESLLRFKRGFSDEEIPILRYVSEVK